VTSAVAMASEKPAPREAGKRGSSSQGAHDLLQPRSRQDRLARPLLRLCLALLLVLLRLVLGRRARCRAAGSKWGKVGSCQAGSWRAGAGPGCCWELLLLVPVLGLEVGAVVEEPGVGEDGLERDALGRLGVQHGADEVLGLRRHQRPGLLHEVGLGAQHRGEHGLMAAAPEGQAASQGGVENDAQAPDV